MYEDELYLFPALDNDFLLCCLKDNNPDFHDHPVIIPDTGVDVTDNRKIELSRSLENDSFLLSNDTKDECFCDKE